MIIRKPRKTLINTIPKLKALAKKMESIEAFAFDTETNTLQVYGKNKNLIVVGVSISWGFKNTYYIPMGHRYDDSPQITPKDFKKYLGHVFENEELEAIVGANIK